MVHCHAAYLWMARFYCPGFDDKFNIFLQDFQVCYRMPQDTTIYVHLGWWFSQWGDKVAMYTSDTEMPEEGLLLNIGNSIFIYRK